MAMMDASVQSTDPADGAAEREPKMLMESFVFVVVHWLELPLA